MNGEKSLLVSKYEKELEESQSFFLQEQAKLEHLHEERIASVQKQNQNLKSQINELISFNDSKKNSCDDHVKQLNELKRLHQEEVQELEKNLALTLSQQLQKLTNLAEQEKVKATKEKDAEIHKLNDSCRDLNEVIMNLQDQVTRYPELLGKNEDLRNKLITEKQRYELLEKELVVEKNREGCRNCEPRQNRISELESELIALRKLEEDNILLASENEKLIEELEIERKKLELAENNNETDSESKMKLEDLYTEKTSSKLKMNSKKFLKRKILQLEEDCKDLSRKLQIELLKSKQNELDISRETSEKEKILQALVRAQGSNGSKNSLQMNKVKPNKTHSSLDSDIPASVLNDEETSSVSEDKDNDYYMVKEELKKSQNRTYLLQVNPKIRTTLSTTQVKVQPKD